MSRKRHNRVAHPRRVNQPVSIFAYMQDSTDWKAWRGWTVTFGTAERMVTEGEAVRVTRKTQNGIVTMYRETQASRLSKPSPATLTFATSKAAAVNQPGVALTRSEQAHVAKLVMWPFVFDQRNAATVGPRVSERELKAAESLLRHAQGPRNREVRTRSVVRYEVAA